MPEPGSSPPGRATSNRPLATCAKGLEGLLLHEIEALGGIDARETVGGVYFDAGLSELYRVCMWSRLASRVLWWVARFETHSAEQLKAGVEAIEWEDHVAPDGTLAVTFHGTSARLKNSHYSALAVKDAIVDRFRDRCGTRPSVDLKRPDLRVHARLAKGIADICIDLSGDALHRRGYRAAASKAPMKENLAAAVLLRAGWPEIAANGGALIDPMCGAGTLLTEGAEMALDRAPGLRRRHWGFHGWLGHVPRYWRDVTEEAEQRGRDGAVRKVECFGYDGSVQAVNAASANVEAAGLANHVRIRRKELAGLSVPTHKPVGAGLVVVNPPYGERLGDAKTLGPLYTALGARLKTGFDGWKAAVLTGNPDLGKSMGLRAHRQYALFNGALPVKLLLFDVQVLAHVDQRPVAEMPGSAVPESTASLDEGAQMFANRLRKNLRGLGKWQRQSGTDCYRIYDADIPEYAVALDVYAGHAHLAEYQAPSRIPPALARKRLDAAVAATSAVLEIPRARIAIKQRQRQRGRQQYQRQAAEGQLHTVHEGNVQLLVNLHDYLDTGLFLDHRIVRRFIGEQSARKRFLNLYCYTASASVHAANGGARFTDSVDLSPTYLDWARRNLSLNGFSDTAHRLHRADVMDWLGGCKQSYDLVLVDPPTFSNSKRTAADFDVQRDHEGLLHAAMAHLAPGGLLIFSTNRRKFELSAALTSAYAVTNRTRWSTDRDFQRARQQRECWFIEHAMET
ncbi:MAG: bifunctional 23S rRNA (guanine(2069)-N(7))-methyltransferase RlmK/23S rRNA (guanine(2445)-N(2))-methyltransferase RlmL [Pseudomonadota bacterium]